MKKTHNIPQHHLPNEPLEPNPILKQMQHLDKLSKPNLVIEHLQRSQAIFEKMQHSQDMLDKLFKPNPVIEQLQRSQAIFEKIQHSQDMLDKLSAPNPITEQLQRSQAIFEKMQHSQDILDKLSEPNVIIGQIQQITQLYEQIYKTDIISSFTSKLKDTEYDDDNLINQIKETKPIVDILKSLPKENQKELIVKIKSYIDAQVDIKLSEKLEERNSSVSSSIEATTIFNDAITAIDTALNSLYGFYAICPDSMKNDVYLICLLLQMSLFSVIAIYFLYNYHKQK